MAASNSEAMAGKWSRGPMKATSSASSSTASGRRECPFCHVALVHIRSKKPATRGFCSSSCICRFYRCDDWCGCCWYLEVIRLYQVILGSNVLCVLNVPRIELNECMVLIE